jgi:hypothetical protein
MRHVSPPCFWFNQRWADTALFRERGKYRRSLGSVLLDNIALPVLDGAADRRNLVGADRHSPIPSPFRGTSRDNAKRESHEFWAATQIRKTAYRLGGHAAEALISIRLSIRRVYI